MLLLDVPITNEAEFVFVGSLAAAAPEVLATVPAARPANSRPPSRSPALAIENLDRSARRRDGSRSARQSTLANLQRRLFNEERENQSEPDDAVEVFSAPGEGRECVEIARRVLSLARGGVPFDRIAVLLRSPEGYRAYLEEAFARAGIPAHFARGAVRPDPAGRAFCALLKCAAEGLSARRFAEYLSLGRFRMRRPMARLPRRLPAANAGSSPTPELALNSRPRKPTEPASSAETDTPTTGQADEAPVREGQLRAPRRWERLLVEAAVIGGRDRWRRRIDGLANDLRLRLSELAEEDETQAAVLARTLEDLAAFAGIRTPSHRCARQLCPSRRTGASGSTSWARSRLERSSSPTGCWRCWRSWRRWLPWGQWR